MIWEGIKGYKKVATNQKESSANHNKNESINGHPANFSIFGTIVGALT